MKLLERIVKIDRVFPSIVVALFLVVLTIAYFMGIFPTGSFR